MKNLKVLWLLVISLLLSACNDTLEPSPGDNIPEPVPNSEMSATEAQEVLFNFLGDNVKTRSNSYIEIEDHIKHNYVLPTTRGSNKETENIPVYEFITREDDKKGFALVIGDKRFNTVLAYIPEGSLEEAKQMPMTKEYFENIPQFLNNYLSQKKIITKVEVDPNPGPNPGDTIEGFNEVYLTYLPTTWGQREPYNMYVPINCGNTNAPAGCTTIAIAQIMAYYRYPEEYNWELILNTPKITESDSKERKHEVARLISNIGENIMTRWSCSGSAGDNFYVSIGVQQMGYIFQSSSNPRVERAYELMINSIKQKMPCYVGDIDHAYVVDGYGYKNHSIIYHFYYGGQLLSIKELATSHYFHLNLGWSGVSDGWYLATVNLNGGDNLVFYENVIYWGKPLEENSYTQSGRWIRHTTTEFRPR